MDDSTSCRAAAAQPPLPVVVTLETGATNSSATPLSFTIPLRTPQQAPSWQELLGQR